MIEQFESYCGCVAEDFTASIIELGKSYENSAFREAQRLIYKHIEPTVNVSDRNRLR